jgi:hypothetical protein
MKRVVAVLRGTIFFKLGLECSSCYSDVKRGDKERYQKTDALDSKNLSNQLKSGVLRGVFIPTEEHEQFTPWLAIERK